MPEETEEEKVVPPGVPIRLQAEKVVITPLPPVTVPAPQPGHPEDKLPSTTTPEEDRTTASQRRVNLIWETTQAIIAVTVTLASLIVSSILCMRYPIDNAALQLLSNSFFLIIGFYFSRTNHTKVGGIGDKTGKER